MSSGDLNGFLLLRGDRGKLDQLRSSQEFTRLNLRAGPVIQNLGVTAAYTGEELDTLLGDFQQQLSELD